MEEFWIIILVLFCATNSLDKAESVKVKLEETPLKTFDEIFGEGWWDKAGAEDLKTPPTNFGQNVHHQIDRQNTQIGQIEPNSTDQLGQIEPNSSDQNPLLLTESDYSVKAKNAKEQNEIMKEENIAENERKRKIIDEFHAIKDEFKQKRKYSTKEWTQIDGKIAKHLKVSRKKIYKWKKEYGLSRKSLKNERKNLLEKFVQRKTELKRDGFKSSYQNEIDKAVAKELGLSFRTMYRWKSELGQSIPNYKHSHSERNELMKCYYEIKDENPKISDENIAKMLKIGKATLVRWKKQFKRQQFHQILSMDILWKRIPRQIFRKLETQIRRAFNTFFFVYFGFII